MAMVEIFYRQHSDLVTDNFKSFLENETYIDLIFMCRNNRKVGAHQMVMGCLSTFLSNLLVQNQIESKDKIIYVYVPDIRAKIMKCILQFVYTGKVMINRDELGELNDDLILLGMPLSVITSVDKRQPSTSANESVQMPSTSLPIPQTMPGETLSNFVHPPNNSGMTISGITSLCNNALLPTNTDSMNTAPAMGYLNQPNQSISRNSYGDMYTMGPTHSLNVPPNVTPLGSIPPSSSTGAQFSAELITNSVISSNNTRLPTPTKSQSNVISTTPSKNIKAEKTPQKRQKSNRNNGAKQQKTSSDQCINLADDDDDEDNDIITIS